MLKKVTFTSYNKNINILTTEQQLNPSLKSFSSYNVEKYKVLLQHNFFLPNQNDVSNASLMNKYILI